MDPLYLGFECLVADLTLTRLAADVVVVRRWGDRHTQLDQLGADRLDTPPQTIRTLAKAPMLGDERGD
jgi:hypothetical protein